MSWGSLGRRQSTAWAIPLGGKAVHHNDMVQQCITMTHPVRTLRVHLIVAQHPDAMSKKHHDSDFRSVRLATQIP
jgi:hypothetical protein